MEIVLIRKAAEDLIVKIQNNKNPVLDIFDPVDFHSLKKRKKKIQETKEAASQF